MTRKADQFEEFHVRNPRVYREMCGFARAWKARSDSIIGVEMILGAARWEVAFAPFYARLIMYREDDLAWLFTTKDASRSDADEWIIDYAARNPRDSVWFPVWLAEQEADEQ